MDDLIRFIGSGGWFLILLALLVFYGLGVTVINGVVRVTEVRAQLKAMHACQCIRPVEDSEEEAA